MIGDHTGEPTQRRAADHVAVQLGLLVFVIEGNQRAKDPLCRLLTDADVGRFHALCDELRTLSHLIDRFRLAQPSFTDAPPATAKGFRHYANTH